MRHREPRGVAVRREPENPVARLRPYVVPHSAEPVLRSTRGSGLAVKIDDRLLNIIILTSLVILIGLIVDNWNQFTAAAL